jgi:1-acyl-sn-glycerol-3-phosphate acyltransferase
MVAHPVPTAFEQRTDIRLLQGVVGLYGRAFHRRTLGRACRLPAHGPAVVAANHTAGLDPVVIQSTCPRPIIWIMTREFYDLPVLKPFLKHVRMIPIDRGGRDSRAWREALRILGEGGVVGVFPEGRIEKSRQLLPLQNGVALLARRGRADLFPVYLDGLQRNTDMLRTYLTPQHPHISWGPCVKAGGTGARSERRDLDTVTAQLDCELRTLADEHPAPYVKGHPMLRRRMK